MTLRETLRTAVSSPITLQRKLGIKNRAFKITFILGVLGFIIFVCGMVISDKSYQKKDFTPRSVVVPKVRGIGFINDSNGVLRTWDRADFLVPPQETDSFFITTNVQITQNQHQRYCAEDPLVQGALCTNDAYCKSLKGRILHKGNGVISGRCVRSNFRGHRNESVCQIYGWCPVEISQLSPFELSFIHETEKFDVFIENNIEFEDFNYKSHNLPDVINNTWLENCLHNRDSLAGRLCPKFRLGNIIEEIGANYADIARVGAVIEIKINWDCNLDCDDRRCVPTYQFKHLGGKNFDLSKGFNFRHSDLFVQMGVQHRNLYRAYGFKFLISVEGKAGKVNFKTSLMRVGSLLSIFGLVSFTMFALIWLNLHGNQSFKRQYRQDLQVRIVRSRDLPEGDANNTSQRVRTNSTALERGDATQTNTNRPPRGDRTKNETSLTDIKTQITNEGNGGLLQPLPNQSERRSSNSPSISQPPEIKISVKRVILAYILIILAIGAIAGLFYGVSLAVAKIVCLCE